MLDQVDDSFHGIVIIGSARLEAQRQIDSVGGSHGGGRRVQINGFAPGIESPVEDRLRQGQPETEAPRQGAHPEALQFPGIGHYGFGDSTPGDETGWLMVDAGHKAAPTLFEIAEWEASGFLLQRAEAEAGGAGLGDDESAVFEQQVASLQQGGFRGR